MNASVDQDRQRHMSSLDPNESNEYRQMVKQTSTMQNDSS